MLLTHFVLGLTLAQSLPATADRAAEAPPPAAATTTANATTARASAPAQVVAPLRPLSYREVPLLPLRPSRREAVVAATPPPPGPRQLADGARQPASRPGRQAMLRLGRPFTAVHFAAAADDPVAGFYC